MSRVVFECDFAEAKEPHFAKYHDGSRLRDKIPTNLYLECSRRWQELGIQLELDSCKPWWAGLLISILTLIQSGYSYESGVDKQLLKKVPIERRRYLESPDAALLAFEQAPQSEQILYLQKYCTDKESVIAQTGALYTAWRTSDLEHLSAILNERLGALPFAFGALVTNRNQIWASKIIKLLQDTEPTLFVLGALHYVGPSSIPACLRSSSCELILEKVI
jgi:uncharacterized protein YbaP (TraB family)